MGLILLALLLGFVLECKSTSATPLIAFREPIRVTILATFLFILTGVTTLSFLKIKKLIDIKRFCHFLEQQSLSFKGLFSAIELAQMRSRDGISDGLKEAHIASVQKTLDKEDPRSWIPLKNLNYFLKAGAIFFMIALSLNFISPDSILSGWNRLILGVQDAFFHHLKIDPQGGQVLLGEPVLITVELLEADDTLPKLYIEGSAGWEEIGGNRMGKKSSFRLKPMIETVRYKVRWRHLESPVYRLEPVEPPRLIDFFVKMTFPNYTRLPPQVTQEEPQIQTFRGTKIDIEARSTKPLAQIEMVSSDGLHTPVQLRKGKRVNVHFTVQNPLEFWFEMKDLDGWTPLQPVRWNVSILEDQPPQIRLLSPVSDLIVEKESRIPFTFEFKDDLGVTSIFLKITKGENESPKRIFLKSYSPSVSEKIDQVDFSLGLLRMVPGEILKMQLEVQDTDLVIGPKSGFSKSIFVEIKSYEKEHQEIEKELKEFRKELMDLLAEQTLSRLSQDEWELSSFDPEGFNKKIDTVLKKQSQIISKTERVEKNLKKNVSRMERDPLSDFFIWSEHKAIQESLNALHSGSMSQAEKSLSEKKWKAAVVEQDSAISELERLSTLSETLYKNSQMKNLMHSADRLTEKGELLNQKLAESKSIDSELFDLLQETLREAQEILLQIRQQIENLPQELPEEFINHPAMKQLHLNEIENLVQKLAQSLQKGEMQFAIQAAQDLLSQAKAARDTIAKASEAFSFFSSLELEKKITEKQKDLEKIIDQQEKILDQTHQLESLLQQSLLGIQENSLLRLADRQRKVLNHSQQLLKSSTQISHSISGELIQLLNSSVGKMENVLKELEQKNVVFSQKWLEEILRHLEPSKKIAERFALLSSTITSTSYPPDKEKRDVLKKEGREGENSETLSIAIKIDEIKVEEQSILDALKNPPTIAKNNFTAEENSKLKGLSQEQNRLAEELKRLRNEISQMTAESALIDLKILESMNSARTEMRSSGKSLEDSKIELAQEHQEIALSYLREGQEKLQNVQQQFGKMAQTFGPRGSGLIQRRAQSGGNIGFRTGVVKIPGADEYLPSREFREEILDSLKERYPKSEEGVIKNYYKKLSQ